MRRSLLLLAGALSVTAALAASDMGKPTFGTFGVDTSAIDKSIKPGDDFFLYTNNNWIKSAVIPPDRSSVGGFQTLAILSETRMKAIVTDLEAKPEGQLSVEEKKLKDLYNAFTDTRAIEANGLTPLRPELDGIDHARTLADVARLMSKPGLNETSVFDMQIGYDEKVPTAYSIVLSQGGLGMPDREYYLGSDPQIVAARDAYKKYLVQMLTLAGVKDADARAAAIYDVEAKIAQLHWTRAENRDEDKTYNPMTISALKKFAPGFAWDAFFKSAGIPVKGLKGERVIVLTQNTAFPGLAKLFAATPVAVWRDYLTVHLMHSFSAYLPKAIDDTDFAFYGTVLGGRSQQMDRETRGVHLLDAQLGEALGKLYTARYFPPESKVKAQKLVDNLLKAYEADIKTLPWMSEATRAKALEKLHKFTPHVGYPDRWINYSAYQVAPGELVADVTAGRAFEWHRELNRIDNTVDKNEWGMTPPTINAYYEPSLNSIFFPAAILQAPFFDPNADDAVNYGAIGSVIGHEMSHGFDDQGAKYDGDGVLRDWWTPEDFAAFKKRTDALSAQFDAYEALPGLHVSGPNTLGENIADLAGSTIALKAYHLSLNGKPAPVIGGLTGDQRFFLSFGQVWRTNQRESSLRTQTLSNRTRKDASFFLTRWWRMRIYRTQ